MQLHHPVLTRIHAMLLPAHWPQLPWTFSAVWIYQDLFQINDFAFAVYFPLHLQIFDSFFAIQVSVDIWVLSQGKRPFLNIFHMYLLIYKHTHTHSTMLYCFHYTFHYLILLFIWLLELRFKISNNNRQVKCFFYLYIYFTHFGFEDKGAI